MADAAASGEAPAAASLPSRSSFSLQSRKVEESASSPVEERYVYCPKLQWNAEVEEYFNCAYGADHFARISEALTQPSCYSCVRVNTLKSSSDSIMQKLKEIIHKSEISDGKKTEADQTNGIKSYIYKCPYPGLENVVFVQGSGPHVVCYGNQPNQPLKEVIVSRKCAESVLRGAQVYVPGVYACSAHVEKGDTVAVSVAVEQPTPDGGWAVGMTRGSVLQGHKADVMYHERHGLYIGKGTASMSRAGIFRALEGVAVEMTDRVYKFPSFNDVLEGEIFLQNLPSIITAYVLDPQPGERILDMCAAPGGKTTAIAILMRNEGEIIATDRSHNKVAGILRLATEMGLSCIKAYKLDALKSVHKPSKASNADIHDDNIEVSDILEESSDPCKCSADTKIDVGENLNEKKPNPEMHSRKGEERKTVRRIKNGPGRNQCVGSKVEPSKGFLPDSFDRVLLDAPCSALGLRPRLFSGEETMESLRNHAQYQRRMLDQAVQLVRPGGVIVYSTCTINPGENEGLVRYALDRYKFLSLASQHPKVGGCGIVGRREMFNKTLVEEWLTEEEAELVQRFDPSSPVDTIGFFIAKFAVSSRKDGQLASS